MASADVQALLADLEAQAAAERAKVKEEAQREIAAIQARTDGEIARIRAEAEGRLQRLVASDRARLMSGLGLEERRRRLEARRAALSEAFALARERLAERVVSPSYPRVLARLAAEALRAVGGDADLEVATQDVALCREIAAAGTVRERAGERGTVAAVSRDGTRRADNSLSMRLSQAERLAEDEVAGVLFGGSA